MCGKVGHMYASAWDLRRGGAEADHPRHGQAPGLLAQRTTTSLLTRYIALNSNTSHSVYCIEKGPTLKNIRDEKGPTLVDCNLVKRCVGSLCQHLCMRVM